MVDITHKNSTLRKAVAQAIVKVSSQETIDKIIQKQIPKGDVFEMAKTAGLFAAKKTSDVIPDCHPLPIEYTKISFEINGLEIIIQTEIHTIYKTGVEVEAMYASSVVAITMYDMLKPVDKSIEVSTIKLIQKTGGKTDYQKIASQVKIGVIVCSDSISAGEKTDRSGKIIIEKMKAFDAEIVDYKVIPDEIQQIQENINAMESEGCNLILITGGTGLSPKDVTPEAIKPLLDKEIPGIVEAIRNYGQQRTPYSMLSRSVAGFKNDMLVIALPGSTNGVSESIDAVFPALFHVFRVRNHFKHNEE
ncbi:bifunctional molybdenum cofactor biosynthesis protein MoaC/MoaB [Flavobacterium sp. UBA6135]|uniref:bifunctional molybdenum cofactor biosynthesis protein MoaC/MoaB n=1 Tax=Flavobacterium sp. UBA6135 TaxID=1946553 RepID=UPI0025C6005E|nr:bifunctional molybdenum cofactor biosynthesis protein MoaC/MoaB [Flavobacterium sp. UBA6135]